MPAFIFERPPSPIESLLFDMDGVLNPSTYGHWSSFMYSPVLIGEYSVQQYVEREVLRELGRDPDAIEWRQYANKGREKIWRETQSDDSPEACVEYRLACAEWQAEYTRKHPKVAQLTEGSRELLMHNYESSNSIPVAIVTSSDRPILESFIQINDIAELVQATVAHKEANGVNKPSPDPYLRAAQLLDVDPECSVGVEDSAGGIQSLREAGVYSVAIEGPKSIDEIDNFDIRANATIASMRDLGRVLGWDLV